MLRIESQQIHDFVQYPSNEYLRAERRYAFILSSALCIASIVIILVACFTGQLGKVGVLDILGMSLLSIITYYGLFRLFKFRLSQEGVAYGRGLLMVCCQYRHQNLKVNDDAVICVDKDKKGKYWLVYLEHNPRKRVKVFIKAFPGFPDTLPRNPQK